MYAVLCASEKGREGGRGEEKVRKGEVGAAESYAIAGERRGCEGAREEEDRRAKNLRTVGRSLLG